MGLTVEPGQGACSPANDDRASLDTQKTERKIPAFTPPSRREAPPVPQTVDEGPPLYEMIPDNR